MSSMPRSVWWLFSSCFLMEILFAFFFFHVHVTCAAYLPWSDGNNTPQCLHTMKVLSKLLISRGSPVTVWASRQIILRIFATSIILPRKCWGHEITLQEAITAHFHIVQFMNRMFIGPCIIVIVEELKTNLMSLVIFISLIICSTCFGH